jgi:predicted XRE-type DNA-binding protein
MDAKKRERLVATGYPITDAPDWLELTPQERMIVNMRVNFALEIERMRKEKKLTQKALAEKIGTKQSGVARMLKCPASATIDNLVKTLITLGATPKHIAALI